MTNWRRVIHMYGRATDTPDHLTALTGHDEVEIEKAREHLTSAVVHQETASMAAAPTLTGILTALTERAITHPLAQAAVVDFLAELGASAQGTYEVGASVPGDLLDQLEALDDEEAEAFLEDEGFTLYESTYDSTIAAIQRHKGEVLTALSDEPWRDLPGTAAATATWVLVPD